MESFQLDDADMEDYVDYMGKIINKNFEISDFHLPHWIQIKKVANYINIEMIKLSWIWIQIGTKKFNIMDCGKYKICLSYFWLQDTF